MVHTITVSVIQPPPPSPPQKKTLRLVCYLKRPQDFQSTFMPFSVCLFMLVPIPNTYKEKVENEFFLPSLVRRMLEGQIYSIQIDHLDINIQSIFQTNTQITRSWGKELIKHFMHDITFATVILSNPIGKVCVTQQCQILEIVISMIYQSKQSLCF